MFKRKNSSHYFLLWLLSGAFSVSAMAQRENRLLNADWNFRFSHQVNANDTRRVDLPHTWNTTDALIGKTDYKRGIGNYSKKLFVPADWRGRRLFLRFEGANSVCQLLVNGHTVGEHRGGYGAFVFEITDRVNYGRDNTLLVRVNNGEQFDVMPLVGDFNIYGGLYRDVHLLLTDSVCISPLDYGSSGIYLVQDSIDTRRAEVQARVMLSNSGIKPAETLVRLRVMDGDRTVTEASRRISVQPQTAVQPETIGFGIDRPHLWQGTTDPFLYRAVITLEDKSGCETDRVEQPLGLRSFHVDAERGFFLNGKHMPLHGVCRHQERAEVGNALLPADHDEDFRLIRQMGANAVRLAHYPQATYVYDIADKAGLIVWAEIPFVGPGGYADKGFADLPAFKENGRQQLKELIRQHYNHPSICFWGIFNELKEAGDNPIDYVRELNALAHEEDPTRPTTAASNQGGRLNYITDLIAWNRYDGWYGSTPSTLATFLDNTHKNNPKLCIGISEYGAGASVRHQQDTLCQPQPAGQWHPENWQTEYHIQNWRIISARPYVWGSFVWNMFDFGAAHRDEGDRPGINDKGLVTHDRATLKDAFFFYKANWNPEPMLHIAGKRSTGRSKEVTDIQVFTNCKTVELRINGKTVARQSPDSVGVCTFRKIRLAQGNNRIEVHARSGKQSLSDQCDWILNKSE